MKGASDLAVVDFTKGPTDFALVGPISGAFGGPGTAPMFPTSYRHLFADLTSVGVGDDIPQDATTTAFVREGQPITGAIDTGGDRDWYSFVAEIGLVYRITLNQDDSNGAPLLDSYLRVYDAAGTLVAENDDAIGFHSRLDLEVTQQTQFYISAAGYGATTGDYTLSVWETGETADYVGGDTTTTGTLDLNTPLDGNIDSDGDQDWYRFTAEAGVEYQFTITTDTARTPPLNTPYLAIYDANGTLLVADEDADNSWQIAKLTFGVSESATFYIAAYGADDGAFRLEATETGEIVDTVADHQGTTAVLTTASEVYNALEAEQDEDWFTFIAMAGVTYVVNLEAWEHDDHGPLSDPYLLLYDATGKAITGNDDFFGFDAQLTFTYDVHTLLYISATSYDGQTGGYRLRADEIEVQTGDNAPQAMTATEGPTVLMGRGGEDTLTGANGEDTLNGGAKADVLMGGAGADIVEGGGGADWADLGAGADWFVDDTQTGAAGADTVYGGNHRDTIEALAGFNELHGGAGDDSIFGGIEADVIRGDGGNDTLIAYAGADDLQGGDGRDLLHGGEGRDTLQGNGGNDTLDGGDGGDDLTGGGGTDRLYGAAGHDTLSGGSDNDKVLGEAGNDILLGGVGHDTLKGGGGQDTLDGGKDDDLLFGGTGADLFVFHINDWGRDTIQDFDQDFDVIHMTGHTVEVLQFEVLADSLVITVEGDPLNQLVLTGVTTDDLGSSLQLLG